MLISPCEINLSGIIAKSSTPLLESLKNLRTSKEQEEQIFALNNKITELTEQSHILSRVVQKGYIDSAIFMEKQNKMP